MKKINNLFSIKKPIFIIKIEFLIIVLHFKTVVVKMKCYIYSAFILDLSYIGYDAGPTLAQHRVNLSCLLGIYAAHTS